MLKPPTNDDFREDHEDIKSGEKLTRRIGEVEEKLHSEHGLLTLYKVETLIWAGFLKPDMLACLKFVLLAPGIFLEAGRLRWHEDSGTLLVVTANGLVRADRLYEGLALGDDWEGENNWHHVELKDGSWRPQRVSLELNTILACVEQQPEMPKFDPAIEQMLAIAHQCIRKAQTMWDPMPGGVRYTPRVKHQRHWKIIDLHDRFMLADRNTGEGSVFTSECRAMKAADLAVLGHGTRHVFLDRFNAMDPGDCS